MTLKSAWWMLDQGQPSNREIASAKVFASDVLSESRSRKDRRTLAILGAPTVISEVIHTTSDQPTKPFKLVGLLVLW